MNKGYGKMQMNVFLKYLTMKYLELMKLHQNELVRFGAV